MNYQDNPTEVIINKEMDNILKIKDAIEVILCNDPAQVERSMFDTVFEAVQVIANSDLKMMLSHCTQAKLTLEDVGNQLGEVLEDIKEKRDIFITARDELRYS